ncbi:AraC family transcriptional regulator [Paractinoplanes rishiriensis]|uniref:HTH araC/xylS-type domain-containing protein n=1 Tax=Paractinoplanes rishiriensis TaxID=1050105 RepID=A0A919K604_9ACTN|nr:helix-turn-helix domain-containing protein [Actinoplanes rishiriensis]GIE97256.1 hypothetical protein Ari01nite_47210 [Actinoplanes rishiriensis]
MLSRLYGRTRLTVTGTGHYARIDRHLLGRTELHRVRFSMRFEADGAPLGTLGIGRVLSGATTCRTVRRVDDYVPGDLYLVAQPDEGYESVVDAADLVAAVIDPALVTAAAGEPVRFTAYRPVSQRAARFWNSIYDYARESAAAAAEHPVLAATVDRLLAATALATFPNTAVPEPTFEDRRDAHPAALRRAISFIDENAHRDIGPDDIAAAARISVRAVRMAFRRYLDITPTAYLRRVRLDHAHHDLLTASPATATVAAIAARWGFADESRFAARYRLAYGRTPADTLRA